MFGWHDMGQGMGIIMMIFWILVVLGVVWLIQNSRRDKTSTESALEIAQKRYAKGEISKEQLDEIKRNL